MLAQCGARIAGLGTSVLEIDGVEPPRRLPLAVDSRSHGSGDVSAGGRHNRRRSDRGRGCPGPSCGLLDRPGSKRRGNRRAAATVLPFAPRGVRPVSVAAAPYPGLPTDLQAHWTAYMAIAAGPSCVEDRVFPMRWGHMGELRRLGADLDCVPGGVRIAGNSRYHAAEVVASDLRASAALILAALAGQGTSTIHAAHQSQSAAMSGWTKN